MTLEDILPRLALLEDREALRSLINKYQRCADEWNYDGTTSCFTEDGVFEAPGQTFRGRAEMLATLPVVTSRAKQKFHMIANLEFDVQGDAATGHGCLHFVSIFDPAEPYLLDAEGRAVGGSNGGGYYDWRFVRTEEGWRIKHQKLVITWTGSPIGPQGK